MTSQKLAVVLQQSDSYLPSNITTLRTGVSSRVGLVYKWCPRPPLQLRRAAVAENMFRYISNRAPLARSVSTR